MKQFGLDYGFEMERDDVMKPTPDSEEILEKIRKKIGDCKRCPLSENRHKIVFGAGNPHAEIFFVGEAPGEEEDIQGIPFVGKAGKLLTDIITKGMGLDREDVYIGNIVKCRPPKNRNPNPEEALACLPFLKAQIAAVAPKVIICLGKVAVTCLLQRSEPIGQLRGKWHSYGNIPVMPTFHPSYLLRNQPAKKDVWMDIQEVMRKLKIPVPAKK